MSLIKLFCNEIKTKRLRDYFKQIIGKPLLIY